MSSPRHSRSSSDSNFVLLGGLILFFVVIWLLPRPLVLQDIIIMPLWLHIVLELIAIVVSGLVFGIGWHNYSHERPANISLIACSFLAIGFIDMAHMLSFKGMPDFLTPPSREKGLNFWLSARLLFAFLMLFIASDSWKRPTTPYLKVGYLSGSLLLIILIYWLGIYHESQWPRTFIEGQGLTPFKINTEIFICGLLLVTAGRLLHEAMQTHRPQRFDAIHQCSHIFAYPGTNRAMSACIRSNKDIPVIIAF